MVNVTLKPMATAPQEVEILAYHKSGGNFHPVKLRGDKVVMRWHDEYSQHKNHFDGWVDMPKLNG